MVQDNFGDWRIRAVLTIAKDIPPAFPGGPSHKKGSPMYLTHVAKSKSNNTIGFITPDVSAMALNISINASKKASRIKGKIKYEKIISPWGDGISVTKETTQSLFNYFENFMTSIVFSFLAVEGYANSLISLEPNHLFSYKEQQFTANYVERNISTKEKVKYILPQITNRRINNSDRVWQDFILLKNARDAIVHIKYKDLFSNKDTIDDSSLYFNFLNNEPALFPKYGYEVIRYFEGDERTRWMIAFEEKYFKKR